MNKLKWNLQRTHSKMDHPHHCQLNFWGWLNLAFETPDVDFTLVCKYKLGWVIIIIIKQNFWGFLIPAWSHTHQYFPSWYVYNHDWAVWKTAYLVISCLLQRYSNLMKLHYWIQSFFKLFRELAALEKSYLLELQNLSHLISVKFYLCIWYFGIQSSKIIVVFLLLGCFLLGVVDRKLFHPISFIGWNSFLSLYLDIFPKVSSYRASTRRTNTLKYVFLSWQVQLVHFINVSWSS